jgi:predicted enzyme related to lactoylglutathione lyase
MKIHILMMVGTWVLVVGGYGLGLNSFSQTLKGPITYIGVEDVPNAVESLTRDGAKVLMGPMDVGGGIILADVESSHW